MESALNHTVRDSVRGATAIQFMGRLRFQYFTGVAIFPPTAGNVPIAIGIPTRLGPLARSRQYAANRLFFGDFTPARKNCHTLFY